MSTNPLHREGGYWKPVLDYEPWDGTKPDSSYSEVGGTTAADAAERSVRHDLCHHCGSEFVVDSPYCRMCGRGRSEAVRPAKATSNPLDFRLLRGYLGLTAGALVCLIVGLACIGAAVVTGFMYAAGTLVDWEAI